MLRRPTGLHGALVYRGFANSRETLQECAAAKDDNLGDNARCCSEHRIMAGPGGLQTGPPQVTSRSGAPSRPRLRSVEGPDRVDVRVACVVRAPGDLEAQLASELPGAMETPWIASPTCCSTRRGSCTASGPTSDSQNCRSDRPLKRHEHRQVTDGKAPREVWGVPGDGWRSRSHSEGSSTPGRRCAEPRGRP
jgi:hypothetical protein